MKFSKSERGFWKLMHPVYLEPHEEKRILSESSAVGDYEDSFEKPGSSFLWLGDHHLNREEVCELRDILTQWLETGRMS